MSQRRANGVKTQENVANTHQQNNEKSVTSNSYKLQLMVMSTVMCCINMIFQEQLLRTHLKCSNFITLVQHIFISLMGMYKIRGLPFGLGGSKPPALSTWHYAPLFILNLLSVLSNNFSINYGVSIPLNMIFKSSSLISNMFLGIILMKHRYPTGKFVAVFLITSGLVLCTYEDYRLKNESSSTTLTSTLSSITAEQILSQTIGILFLVASLLLSSGTGIYQEFLKKNFGKHPEESLFYVHLLALPLVVLTCAYEPAEYWHVFTTDIWACFYLAAIVITQYQCIQFVYRLTSECASLTVTLCVTNRKFLSLLFSIFYFGNAFTLNHWVGTFIVFGATLMFILVDRKPKTD